MMECNIPSDECFDPTRFCALMMRRYFELIDNATYMPHEHIQKEKEYGIPWRTAFKQELLAIGGELIRKREKEVKQRSADPFVDLLYLAKKDQETAQSFNKIAQADLLYGMKGDLEELELVLYKLKGLLKEPRYEIFEDVKSRVQDKV